MKTVNIIIDKTTKTKETIQVQVDKDKTGRYSVTLKLIAWNINELRALTSMLTLNPMGRHIANKLGPALQTVQNDPIKEQTDAVAKPTTKPPRNELPASTTQPI